MNFWFGMSKEELYKNSEAINSDVVFFVSKTSPELHSGIHIYDDSDQPADNEKELVNFIAKGELVSCQLMDDYTDKEGECEYSGSYLLLKHYGKYNKNNPKKELLFYVLYTHLLPVKYYYFVKTEGMNATYSNEVNRDNIGEFEFVKHRIPFYLKYKITVKSGYDIPVLGNGMPKYSQHKVVAKDNEELYKYVLSLASGQECTNVPEGTCTILYNGKDNEVPLKNIEIVKTNAKVKIRKGAQVYNSKWKELGTVNKLLWSECCKVTEQDNEIKVQVSIKGEDLNITKGGYVVVDTAKKDDLYRIVANVQPVIYAPKAVVPTQDEMKTFLQYFYPLQKISASDIISGEDIIKYKQNGKIYIDEKKIMPLEKRFEQSTTGDIKYFYRITGNGVEIRQTDQKENKEGGEELIEEDFTEIDIDNIEFYKDTLNDDEDILHINRYKIQQRAKPESVKLGNGSGNEQVMLIEANLYITSYFDEKVYVDMSAIERVEFTGKITETLQTEKGVLIYNENIPERIIKEEDTIEISPEYVRDIYNEYKNQVLGRTDTEGILVGIGGNKTIRLGKEVALQFKVEQNDGYIITCADSTGSANAGKPAMVKEIRQGAILGHGARQVDRKYTDISIFTFEGSIYNDTVWKILAGTHIYTYTPGDKNTQYNLQYLETAKNNIIVFSQPEEEKVDWLTKRYSFLYKGKKCCIEKSLFEKKKYIECSRFNKVKIDDQNSLITGIYEIYNVKKEAYEKYKWKELCNLLINERNAAGGLRESLRRSIIIKPLEFDCEKIGDDYIDRLKKFGIAVSQCEKRNAIYDIYGKLKKETVDFKNRENRFCFYHPVTFIDHVKNNVLLEYNPYEGKTYKEVYAYEKFPIINGENFTETQDFKIVDTPGFAPVYDETHPNKGPNINGYAPVTGFFNEDYLDVKGGNGWTYRENGYTLFNHEGVDFRGRTGTKIKSLIYGTVLAYGKYSTYGRTIFVCNRERTGVYLLAHLSKFEEDVLEKVEIIPGDVVGYVGTSGSADTSGNVDGRYDAHLHVSYFKIGGLSSESDIKTKIVVKDTGDTIEWIAPFDKTATSNPFNHESKRKPSK
ncbi:MAG: peptidoglycan DD-metalloendopeptidase family protein [Candidatus Treponema excrementipullorum]|nr:peptidoglycan DD-metalloendopeptidase family protein [Spirochaetia bacterium]MDD7011230.1 peptidoglycan DD-metalloendopeptidase family protein [Candidatus Treponema excrementipullorum]